MGAGAEQGKEGGHCRVQMDVAQRPRGPRCHALFLGRSGPSLAPPPRMGILAA